jgi:serine/threonine protein kinase
MDKPFPKPSEPSEIAGRYVVLVRLGAGAFGTVYKVRDRVLGRLVAIKILTAGLLPQDGGSSALQDRFLQEAKALAGIKHPNIVMIYDLGREADGSSYLAMELVDGITLDTLLVREGRLPWRRAVAIGAQIADALDFAHRQGVVHRDLKPANVMLEVGDKVKVTDFGIAKLPNATKLTMTGNIVGTPGYMSPEQVQEGRVDGRSDIFSLGCVLYEMLSGERAFTSEGVHAILFKIVSEDPRPLRSVAPEVPEEVARIVTRALAKKPEARYASGADLQKDLLGVLSPPTIVPPPTRATAREAPPTLRAPPPSAPRRKEIVPTELRRVARPAVVPERATPPPAQATPAAPPERRSPVLAVASVGCLGLGVLGVVVGIGAYLALNRSRVASPAPAQELRASPGGPPATAQAPSPSPSPEVEPSQAPRPGPLVAERLPSQPPDTAPPPSPEARPSATKAPPAPASPQLRAPATLPTASRDARPSPALAAATPPPAPERSATPLPPRVVNPPPQTLLETPPPGPRSEQGGRQVADAFRNGKEQPAGTFGATGRRFRPREREPKDLSPGEKPAVAMLRSMITAEEAHYRKANRYAGLDELLRSGEFVLRIPHGNGSFQENGYRFELKNAKDGFNVTATPLTGGVRAFSGDDSDFIRSNP